MRGVKTHFDFVLYRVCRLVLQTGGTFVPKHAVALVEGHIAQTHGVCAGEPTCKPRAELGLVNKTIGLAMARGAGFGVVEAQADIVEQHASERGTFVGRDIGGRLIAYTFQLSL